MKSTESVYSESTAYGIIKSIFTPFLRPAFCKCVPSIFFNFFLRQYHGAFFRRIPISSVDHPLDEKIPFVPSWVTIYLDFVQYWIRMLSFFLRRYGRRAFVPVRDFILSMGELYAYAAEIYSKNFSTTKRPFYIARPRFFLIHLVDPHLMCIPSLHVMVVVFAHKMFAKIAKDLGEEEALKSQREARGAFSGGGEMPSATVAKGVLKIADVLVALKLASSKGEAKRLIQEGGVKINDAVINSIDAELTKENIKKGFILHKGKKVHIKVEVASR